MTNNIEIFKKASRFIPGGVNSPVRAFLSVGGTPKFIEKASGPYIWDIEGKKYIDYVGSWGPAILGHAHPEVIEAVTKAAEYGLSFGAPTKGEVILAEMLVSRIPSIDKIRLVNSGTEATMTAIRLARGYTGRTKIVKFEGCYHGHSDSLLVKAGSGLLTFGNPSSAGVPDNFVKDTISLEYNNSDIVKEVFQKYGHEIACIIVEPIAGNMNMVKPKKGFLEDLRTITEQHKSLLIFDEVMTGFRVGPTGVQGMLNILPDITTFAKIIGGGMPIGAIGGTNKIMSNLAPEGKVYQAGTLSGNPVAVAAGIKTLEIIERSGFYERLSIQTEKLSSGLQSIGRKNGFKISSDYIGGMFGLYFCEKIPTSFEETKNFNSDLFKKFFNSMLDKGVYLSPSAFEAGFVSSSHTDDVIDETLHIADKSFKEISQFI
ncbi:glutamate-1-semialdehyde 2,1-aminomutase [Candidatus Kinetoplastidibacterium crithidiae]|uniref:Glutamate-1-semialdehyde 2,1-aminomutase n=2 Tax=Candidatus Kinetoplastidibacterium crithidiae TaxID=33056 RepID=M1LQN1_9PROT|nr:glutamate-1-semialdehyde 2,1-aminomutase [Candidatus Kinetoplastibacterium crithidii]AEM25280.1 glutamate-1-semialdehyde 2,1-aminomutase [Candidatus Kinetoplastibacterium crithidii]AFZ82906.1 glutamate-1-semialdehyde-2,1-aminomutase [Candidatus Kinetoplastibacterium crithidii (ex Angomonas deanei ATCC 30255)]AGF47907.1 glutamate-1-semialdehyde 2,1-aminomutase GSA [Candidatus Kinetoplastibacterium crithidii TCC036E]